MKINTEISIEWLCDKIPAIALILPGVGVLNLNWNPFYNDAWLELYKGWIFVPIILTLVWVILAFKRWGLIALIVIALAMSLAFGFLYDNSEYQEDHWRITAWVLSFTLIGCVASLALGALRLWIVSSFSPKPNS